MPDPEPYLAEDGRIRIADPYVSQFTTDEAAPADGWGCYPSCEPGCARHCPEAVSGK